MSFHKGSANFPWRPQAHWIADVLSRWHHLDEARSRRIAQACFRSDIYREALTPFGEDVAQPPAPSEGKNPNATPLPSSQEQVIPAPDRFFNGAIFDFAGSN